MENLIDIHQLSEFLCVKPATIYGWIHEERIPYYKLNNLVRFNVQEISEWLAKKKCSENKYIAILKRHNA